MNQIFGWKQGSEMPSIYVRLSERDIKDSILDMYGLKTSEKSEKEKFIPVICSRCKTVNKYESRFCSNCGLVLDVKEAYRLEKIREEREEKITKVLDALTKMDKETMDKLFKLLSKF